MAGEGDDGEHSRDATTNRGGHIILAGAVLVLAVVGAVVFFAAPNTRGTAAAPFTTVTSEGKAGSAVDLQLTVDSVSATTGSASINVVANPGREIPPEGAVVFSSLASSPAIVVRPQQLNSEVAAQVPFTEGNVVDYPFEDYRLKIAFIVLNGTDVSLARQADRRALPFEIEGRDDAAGVTVTGTHSSDQGQVNLALQFRRTPSIRGWVVAMMAIYWVLALGAAAIAIAVIAGLRPFESRLLAWLSALLFALISFRTAAPGTPPIGTFLDFFAVFEAVGIVSASLLALMVLYLARTRKWLRV